MNGTLSYKTNPPMQLDGFKHVKRYWDNRLGTWVARILPGEYYSSCQGEAITTVLGSCVACCIRDPSANLAGMNHFMLPSTQGKPNWGNETSAATRYGSHAMEQLINSILRNGGRRDRLEAKLFGGGRVLSGLSDIGNMNIQFAHAYLHREGIPIVAEDTGGESGRRVIFMTDSGRVRVRLLTISQTVVRREVDYLDNLVKQPIEGEMELFD